MAEIDNPLKMLISEFSPAFATWLLGRPIQSVRALNVEFPANPVQSDLLFEVIDQQSRKLVLHIELQGRRSHKPMAFRQLEYMSQTVIREFGLPLGVASPRLHSVVIYVGVGSGRNDTGSYTVYGLGDNSSLAWQYQVVRLWEMPAADLLPIGQAEPALLALLGQTNLEEPEHIMPQALARIRQVKSSVDKGRILTALVSLLQGEEVITMVEKLLEADELLLDTPYLQRIRRLGREEGRQEGVLVGQEMGLRQAIRNGLLRKSDLLVTDYKRLEQYLEQIHRPADLHQILLALLDGQNTSAILKLAKALAMDETMIEE